MTTYQEDVAAQVGTLDDARFMLIDVLKWVKEEDRTGNFIASSIRGSIQRIDSVIEELKTWR